MNHKDRAVVSTRRALIQQLVLIGAAAPLLSRAAATQSTRSAPRIGKLGGDFPIHLNAFLTELRKQGFVDGENVVIENRIQRDLAEGPPMAKELAQMPLDFIVVAALPSALRVRARTRTCPW